MPSPALTGKLYFVLDGKRRTAGLTLTALPTGLFKVTAQYRGRDYCSEPRELPEKGRREEIVAVAAALPGPWKGTEVVVDFR